jgi:hypothetical protein
MRWIALVGVLVVVSTAGCGGSGDPRASTNTDRKDISAVVRRAIHQATDGRARKACSYITPAGHVRMLRAYRLSYPEQRFSSCPQIVRFERKSDPDSVDDARHAVILRLSVRDARAVAVVGRRGRYEPHYRLFMVKTAGRWRVDDSDVLPAGQ